MADVNTYSVKRQGNFALTPNFKVREFACKDGSDKVLISTSLVDVLQKIRTHFGKPVVINSAYRSESYNAQVGGSSKSQHLYGTAADIVVSGVLPEAVAQYAEYLMPNKGGIGVYSSFIHIDVRTDRYRWDSRSGKEVSVSGWPGYSEKIEPSQSNGKYVYAKIPLKKITQMKMIQTNGKKTLAQVKKDQGCQYVINLTLYNTSYKPLCPFRIDGQTVTTDKYGYWCYAFNVGSDFQMIHSNDMNKYKNVFACSTLLKDGKNTTLSYNSDQGGVRGRTAIGIDGNNNLVLFCSKDGSKLAMNPETLQGYMKNAFDCKSAIMMDSGGSSQCDFDGKKVTSTRKVANYLCIWTDKVSESTSSKNNTKCPYTEPTTSITVGSRGDGAKWVQWYLKEVYDSTLVVDGIIGNKSVIAIKGFQKRAGLDDDGICGRLTREALKQARE